MIRWARLVVASVVAWGAVFLWAYAATVLQLRTESGLVLLPADDMAPTDAYWARDLRWCAILAVLGVLVTLSRGDWRRCAGALAGALAWVGVDVALDRADPGRSALLPLALGAGAVVTVALVAVHLRPGKPGRRLVTAAAAACATTAVLGHDSYGSSAALVPARLALVLLAVVALACALTAAPAPAARRAPIAVAVGGTAFALAAGPTSVVAHLAGAVVLVAGVWLLSRRWPGWRNAAAGVAGVAVGLPAFVFVAVSATSDAGRPLTALAGNPQISPADLDMLFPFIAVLVGLAFAAARALQAWVSAELRADSGLRRPALTGSAVATRS